MATQGAITSVDHLRNALSFFETFKENVLDAPPPESIHPGLYRTEAIRNHHMNANEFLKPDMFDSPLGSIAAKDDGVFDDVADAMIFYPWTEVYGLSYIETWQLPYDRWVYLYNTIRKKYPKGRQSFNSETAPPKDPTKQEGGSHK